MNAEESPIKSSVFQQKPFHRANQLQKIKRTSCYPALCPNSQQTCHWYKTGWFKRTSKESILAKKHQKYKICMAHIAWSHCIQTMTHKMSIIHRQIWWESFFFWEFLGIHTGWGLSQRIQQIPNFWHPSSPLAINDYIGALVNNQELDVFLPMISTTNEMMGHVVKVVPWRERLHFGLCFPLTEKTNICSTN